MYLGPFVVHICSRKSEHDFSCGINIVCAEVGLGMGSSLLSFHLFQFQFQSLDFLITDHDVHAFQFASCSFTVEPFVAICVKTFVYLVIRAACLHLRTYRHMTWSPFHAPRTLSRFRSIKLPGVNGSVMERVGGGAVEHGGGG